MHSTMTESLDVCEQMLFPYNCKIIQHGCLMDGNSDRNELKMNYVCVCVCHISENIKPQHNNRVIGALFWGVL